VEKSTKKTSIPEIAFLKTRVPGHKKLKFMKLKVPGQHKLYIPKMQFYKADIYFYTYEICTFIEYGDDIL
jgi:hypothetical protein